MRRTPLLIALALSALVAVALPLTAGAKSKKSKKSVITKVSPMRAKSGTKLTIRGKNFSSSRKRNTVIFKGASGKTIFVKPRKASRHKLVVVIPSSVEDLIKGDSTRLRLRVVVRRVYGKQSSPRHSPLVLTKLDKSPKPAPKPAPKKPAPTKTVTQAPAKPAPKCPNVASTDPDGDLVSTIVERQIGTNPCDADSDNDGVDDGFEYASNRDLNDDEYQEPNSTLPAPNPLNATDATKDFDGDSLTMKEEYALWKYTIAHGATKTLSPLTYSDGEQYSVNTRNAQNRRVPTLLAAGYAKQADFLSWASTNGYRTVELSDGAPWYAHDTTRNSYGLLDFNRDHTETSGLQPGYFHTEATYYDLDHDGYLSDDERDEDADGLTNFDETHGRMTSAYWNACYSGETPFGIVYADTSPTNPDSDGDTVRDGADDQDHDDIPNVMELSRNAASGLDDLKPGKLCTANDAANDSNFEVTGGPLPDGALVVNFHQDFGSVDVPQMTADGSDLSGGTSPSITVATTRQGGTGVDERQTVTIDGNPDAGGFTLTFNGQTTPRLPYNADAATVQAALEDLFPASGNSNHPNAFGRLNPFNPCLPATWSRTCTRHPGLDGGDAAPFDDSLDWNSLN